ncbi:MAG: potassium channel family protein [Elainella sp. Prado103]|jgi:hypothetical protein|nr:potassium channel family protein [Elainella sp. Prado103]
MRLPELIRAVENKYNRFLTFLIVIYLFSPFLEDRSIGSAIIFLLFLGSVIIVVYQIQHSKRTLKLHVGLVVLALSFRILSFVPSIPIIFSRTFDVFSTLILLAFLMLSSYLIQWELTITEQVTADLVKGGICIYFLIGFFWAALYGIVYSFDPNAFNAASVPLTRADLTHFSFTTLTTVGYGDISPASEIARVLANLEGMVGVMYPAVFIARLVSLHSKG